MRPENMPGYREPKIRSKLKDKGTASAHVMQDVTVAPLMALVLHDRSGGHESCLKIVPILTGHLTEQEQNASMKHIPMHNHDIPVFAAELTSFSFIVYGFNSGHFLNGRSAPPIDIVMSADVLPSGRAMFKQYAKCPKIADSADSLLHMIAASKAKTTVHGYCIHFHSF